MVQAKFRGYIQRPETVLNQYPDTDTSKGLIKLSDVFNKVAHLLFDEEMDDEHWFSKYMHTEP